MVAVRSSLGTLNPKNASIEFEPFENHPKVSIGHYIPLSDTYVTHDEMEILFRANIKQALGSFRYRVQYKYGDLLLHIDDLILYWKILSSGSRLKMNLMITASATLRSNIMIKKSVSMWVRMSQNHMKAMLLNKDDQEIKDER
ncbi:hypothetical protein Tco_0180320 [Tanacetum coccineum]